ncbi:MAG: hypothetical protein AB1714_14625 [Acidobacteriota bacterium]
MFPLDDAYIHLSYVKNLAETGALCFNPGEPSIGTSSPLWVAFLVPFYLAGLDMYWTVQLTNLFLLGLLSYLAMDITRTIAVSFFQTEGEAMPWSFLGGLLLVLNGNVLWFALSGMETMLYLCTCLLAIKLYLLRGFDYITGLTCGLVFLARETGVVLGLVFLVADSSSRRFLRLFRGAMAMLLVISPYLWLTVRVTGGWFPSTARGKLASYVDGGLDWQRIPRTDLHDDLAIRNLIEKRVFEEDPTSRDYVLFCRDVKTESDLSQRLRAAGISESEEFLAEWRLTHRNHIYWYLKTVLLYQKYQPQNLLLMAVLCAWLIHLIYTSSRRWRETKKLLTGRLVGCSVLIAWGFLHLSLHAVGFRTLLHHTRYLADEYLILAIAGSLGFIWLHRRYTRSAALLAGVALFTSAGGLFYWRDVYAHDIKHMDDVYVRMGDWIERNTPDDARIAAFDIGVLRYVGNRYTIDLGGLVDANVVPYLARRECGEYVRQRRADYILYSRNLEVDYFTGLYLAEYEGRRLLKQAPVVHFDTSQYSAPTLTHSFRLDLTRIAGWLDPTIDGIQRAFCYDGRPYQVINETVDNRLEFVGYSVDQRAIELIPYYPYGTNVVFFFRARQRLSHLYWVHLALFDSEGRVFYLFSHIPTHNLLPYDQWPVGQLVQEHHILFAPTPMPRARFHIRVTVNRTPFLDRSRLGELAWYELGTYENLGNALHPMDHQELMCFP